VVPPRVAHKDLIGLLRSSRMPDWGTTLGAERAGSIACHRTFLRTWPRMECEFSGIPLHTRPCAEERWTFEGEASASGLADQLIDLVAVAVKDSLRIGAQSMIKKRRVDRPEVGSGLEVAVIQIGHARLVAEDTPRTPRPSRNTRPAGP
jgi:hypothetical protein